MIWNYPTKIRFGVGELRHIASEVKALGASRVLLVVDAKLPSTLVERVQDQLQTGGVAVTLFDGVHSNPQEADAAKGAAAFVEAACQLVVGLGGGSALDGAKLVAVRVKTPLGFEQLDDALGGDRLIPSDIPPILAIPTTAGTGSEVGRAAVVTAATTGRKTVIFHPAMLPRVAILDPELTTGLPATITAATGYDALTHCLEAYVARGDHPMADGIALEGMMLVIRSLERATADGSDLGARGDMLKAAMMGAVAFQKGLGACHSMAHPLSSECGVHHGLANALCLPAVVEFNMNSSAERYERVARLFGGRSAKELPDILAALRARLSLVEGLLAAGVSETHMSRLAELAMLDGCHQQNPRTCSHSDFESLFRQCY